MNKRFHIYGYIIIICLACSCSKGGESSTNEPVQALPVDNILEGQAVPVGDEAELLNVGFIGNIEDEYLIIFEHMKQDEMFHVFNLPDIEYLYSWGRQGEGPGEFSGVLWNSINIQDGEIITYDFLLLRLQYFTITDTASINTRVRPISYFYRGGLMNRLQRLKDDLFVVSAQRRGETNREYIAFNPDRSDTLFTFGDYPESDLEGSDLYNEFMKIHVSKPDESKFVAFYINHNKFKILNDRGEELKVIDVEDPSIPQVDPSVTEDGITYRSTLYASDSYIYAIAYNATTEEFRSKGDAFRSSLEIWDWEGQPVYRSMFDRRIVFFTVSESHNKLYGISDYDSQHIIEYELPDSLELEISEDR